MHENKKLRCLYWGLLSGTIVLSAGSFPGGDASAQVWESEQILFSKKLSKGNTPIITNTN